MGNHRQFLYHTLVFGIGGALAQLIPVILLPLYTNYLTPEEYGVLDIIHRVAGVVNTVLMVRGIRIAVFSFYRQAENEEAKRRVAVTVSLLLWLTVSASIVFVYFFAGYIDVFLKIGDNQLLVFGLITCFLESLVIVPMSLTQIRLESVRYVLTNLTMLLAKLAFCIYLVAGLQWGVWGVLISQYVVTAVFSILLMARELKIGSVKPDFTQWGAIFRFCWPFVPTGVIAFFYHNADRFFIINYGPYDDYKIAMGAVGIYALAFRLVSITDVFGASPMMKVWSAQMYDIYKQPDAQYVFGNFMLRILFVQAFFSLGICIFSPEIVMALCAPAFVGAIVIIPVAAITSCLAVVVLQMESIFYITRTTIYKPVNQAVILPCIALGMYLLVPRYGIFGAAIASSIATFVNCVVLYFITQRFFAVKYPFKRIFVMFALVFLCYLISPLAGSGIHLSELTPEQLAQMTKQERLFEIFSRLSLLPVLWKSFCVILWLTLVWFSGALLKDDKEMLIRFIKKALEKVTKKIGGRKPEV